MNDAAPEPVRDAASLVPLVSVILPVRNPDPVALQRCLASFASLPSAARLELVLVHTGPFEPGPFAACMGRFGSRTVFECVVPGIYAAFNAGIERARGRFLLFYGHDDIALPDMEEALGLLAREPGERTLLACGVHVQGLGDRYPSRLRQGIVFRNWGHQGLFYPALALRGRGYDLRYPLRADHRLNIALLADGSIRVVRLRQVVTYFTRGGFSSATIADVHFDAEQASIAALEFGWPWGIAVRRLIPLVRALRRLLQRWHGAHG